MIVDASAVIAIVNREPEQDAFAEAIARDAEPRISAANWLEVMIWLARATDTRVRKNGELVVDKLALTIEPVSVEQVRLAREAYRTYGKGSGHRAGLNFGDCFAYALAKTFGEPILFKGDNFARTDLKPARV